MGNQSTSRIRVIECKNWILFLKVNQILSLIVHLHLLWCAVVDANCSQLFAIDRSAALDAKVNEFAKVSCRYLQCVRVSYRWACAAKRTMNGESDCCRLWITVFVVRLLTPGVGGWSNRPRQRSVIGEVAIGDNGTISALVTAFRRASSQIALKLNC